MPKGNQGTKRPNKEESSSGQSPKASPHAEARLANKTSSESSLDQFPWPGFDNVEFLNSLQPPEVAEDLNGGDGHADLNDLFPPFSSSETSSEDVNARKRRATMSSTEDTMPLFLPSLNFEIDPNLPQDEL
ncbi:MAG: hypothetical protein Q9172_006937 [Xanthocarpia lactea]